MKNFLTRHRKVTLWICILVWVCAFGVTHIPAEKLPKFPTGDKTLHLVGYFVLCCFLLAAVISRIQRSWVVIVWVLVLISLWAGVDEITQPLVNRYASFGDWIADIIGAGIALAGWGVIKLLHSRQSISE